MTLRYSIDDNACQDEAGEPHVKPGERNRVWDVTGYLEAQESGIGIGSKGKTGTRAKQLHAERDCGCSREEDESLLRANTEETEEQYRCCSEENMQRAGIGNAEVENVDSVRIGIPQFRMGQCY